MLQFLGRFGMKKKEMREEIENCRAGIANRESTNEALRQQVAQLKSELRKSRRREDALRVKIEVYETAYHSAQEFLLSASRELTDSYTLPITQKEEDTDNAP